MEKTREPQVFTLGNTAVMLLGCVILGAIYPYLILKTGIVSGITMVSAMLTIFFFKAILRRKVINAREANLVQTAMTTSANVGFMAVVLAALDMLGIKLSPLLTFFWLVTSAGIGTLMAVPFRRQLIDVEQLPFPHGRAIGDILNSLEDQTDTALKKTKALSISGVFAAVFVWVRNGLGWIPTALGNQFKVGFEPSLMLMGLGALLGVRTAIWLLIGALLMWGVFAPMMVANGIAHETAIAFAMQKEFAAGSYFSVLVRWTMWPATAVLLAYGLTSILLDWRSLVGSFRSLTDTVKAERRGEEQEVPLKPLVIGLVVLTAILCVIQRIGFGIGPGITILAVLVSFPLMLVGLRVKGETGIGPISDIAAMGQLFFGVFSPGNIATNMSASGTTAAVAIASENIMDDMKAAKGVGNKPQSLTFLQLFVGIPIGALMTVIIFPVLRSTYGFGENGLPAPTSHKWQGLAQLLSQGLEHLPKSSVTALTIAFGVGIVFAFTERRWPKWTPSAMGIGTALLLPAQTVMPIALGSILAWLFSRYRPEKSSIYLVPVAAGLLSGEAMMSLAGSILKILGIIKTF